MAKTSNSITTDRRIGFLHWVKKRLLPEVQEPANQIGIKITLELIELMEEVKKNKTSLKQVTQELKDRRTVRRLPKQQRIAI